MFAYIPHELQMLQTLLSYRVEALNPFFILLNHLDKGTIYGFMGVALFTFLNPKLGIRYFMLLGFSMVINYFLKNLLLQPRPLILDPALGLVTTDSQYGLPSGAAQAATAIALFIVHYYKNHWVKMLAIGYVMLMCVSRVYLGMHFISDILGGILVGFLLAKAFLWGIAPFERWEEKVSSLGSTLFIGSMLILTVSFHLSTAYQMGIGLILGVIFLESALKIKLHHLSTASFSRRLIAFGFAGLSMKVIMLLKNVIPQFLVFYSFTLPIVVALITYWIFNLSKKSIGSVLRTE